MAARQWRIIMKLLLFSGHKSSETGLLSPAHFPHALKEMYMPDATNNADSLFNRVLENESAKKGIAAAGAGILIAVISELVWPSSS